MTKQTKIGFLGGGNMSAALIAGLVGSGPDSSKTNADKTDNEKCKPALLAIEPKQIYVHDRNLSKNQSLSESYGIRACSSPTELIESVDVIVIAVKPNAFKALIMENKTALLARRSLIISVAAGIKAESIQNWLEIPVPIIRAMPNTPAFIGEGATGLYANSNTSSEQKQLATAIMSAVGLCVWVESDADIDAVTALSGSGPAYFMLLTQALISAGVNAGLNHAAATQLALQTARGAGLLVATSDKPIETLIENVKSPKGTTEQAINSFAASDLSGIVGQAFEAARLRASVMAEEFS